MSLHVILGPDDFNGYDYLLKCRVLSLLDTVTKTKIVGLEFALRREAG